MTQRVRVEGAEATTAALERIGAEVAKPPPAVSVVLADYVRLEAPVLTGYLRSSVTPLEDGAVADLSASRVSRSPVRKFRVFGTHFYASADLQLPELRVERRPGPDGQASTARAYEKPDALKTEIEAFVATVRGEPARIVTGREGRNALALALEVNDGIVSRLERLSQRPAP